MRDYFIGLDIGTDSVGWAVTDPEYHIQKKLYEITNLSFFNRKFDRSLREM